MEVVVQGESSDVSSKYTLNPSRICNEDILLCVDVDVESLVEMKSTGSNGRPLTRLDSIKQAILMFIHAKLSINPDHRFAFATLSKSASLLRKEFSSEVESAVAAVMGLSATSSCGPADLTSLFQIASHEAKKSRAQNRIFRVGYGVEDGAFCGVFDGHGKNGHIVSKIVCNRLASLLLSQRNALAKTYTVANDSTFQNHVERIDGELRPSKNFHIWKEACISAFKLMDKEVQLQKKLDSSCSGTTAVVVIRQDEDLIIANLGDSRAVLGTITNNGVTAIQLTTDLKPGLPCEAERIRNCNGRVAALRQEPHVQRVWLPHDDSPGLAMSRAIGDFILKNHGIIAIPNIYYHCVTSNDQFIILATDGVWDVLNNDQVASIVWAADSEQAAARAVVEAATATWKKRYPCAKVDDCTATCLFLQKKQHFIVPVET